MKKRNWDYVWKTFNCLTLLEEVKIKNGYRYWHFQCECGEKKVIELLVVLKGIVKSCGCYIKRYWSPLKIKERDKCLYSTYHSAKSRCTNINNDSFARYWWRGIKFLWKNYDEFYKDMYDSYIKHKHHNKYTLLDRIDNDWHYCKKNCRWLTHYESNRNLSQNRYYTIEWETLCVTDLAKKYWVNPSTLFVRLYRWQTIQQALKLQ